MLHIVDPGTSQIPTILPLRMYLANSTEIRSRFDSVALFDLALAAAKRQPLVRDGATMVPVKVAGPGIVGAARARGTLVPDSIRLRCLPACPYHQYCPRRSLDPLIPKPIGATVAARKMSCPAIGAIKTGLKDHPPPRSRGFRPHSM